MTAPWWQYDLAQLEREDAMAAMSPFSLVRELAEQIQAREHRLLELEALLDAIAGPGSCLICGQHANRSHGIAHLAGCGAGRLLAGRTP